MPGYGLWTAPLPATNRRTGAGPGDRGAVPRASPDRVSRPASGRILPATLGGNRRDDRSSRPRSGGRPHLPPGLAMELIVKNGTVATAADVYRTDVGVAGGRVVA